MDILRKGDKDALKGKKYFCCDMCGAVWTAIKGEYQIGSQYNETEFYCNCPTEECGALCKEITEEEATRACFRGCV